MSFNFFSSYCELCNGYGHDSASCPYDVEEDDDDAY